MTIKGIEKGTGRVAWFRAEEIGYCLMCGDPYCHLCNVQDCEIMTGMTNIGNWEFSIADAFKAEKPVITEIMH